ncbi:uncharacterized protein LOC122387155 [Amphibalanus amphitrite]|uniref:uncharacterized protein LOC122387155 n=1 Tax=Amphibalanus amphitrite TaxID=1232801 RepID=UPI001C9195F7|nr:uncharacterized protein LOC122387155 [Amphibalanus amphitrite]XP_043233003.1 uncharacterized protein LOC122387155 [Amphibalanus amphitrite]XP_043233004.1 uncharacterized protein LOC122387155 [Amphibalanus amphitrite]
MADIIILSDDDFTPPAAQQHRKGTSDSKKDKTAKQWNDIFSYKSRRDKGHQSHYSSHRSSERSSHRSSEHSSRASSDRSSRHSSHRSSDRRASHQSPSHRDKGRREKERTSSGKSIITLYLSDDDQSPARTSNNASSKKSSSRDPKESTSSKHSKKSSHHSDKSSNHHRSEKSSEDRHSKSASHHSSASSHSSPSKHPSVKVTLTKLSSDKASAKVSSSGAKPAHGATPSGSETVNGRHSGSRRSLAAELGVTKADCRRDDDAERLKHRDRRLPNGECSKSVADDRNARSKRPAGDAGGEKAIPEPKRARLCRVDQKTEETLKPKPEPEQKPEPDPCQEGLEEVCTLLKPLLSGPELKIEAKVRRRHAAVLALTSGRPGRVQHLIGVTRQCAERLRAEPDRCFTVVRGFLEQLDQFKIVASSAQSRTAPGAAVKPNAAAVKTDTATTNNIAKVADKVDKSKKANAGDAPKTSTSPSATVNGSVTLSEEDEKEKRRHRRHVAKLEKTLRRLEREIVRQEEQEVDWDDAAGSSYIVGARLKRRYVQVYRYYCRLVGAAEEAEKLDSRRIRFDGTRYPEINRRIEKFVNRTREFPDFKDVLSLIEQANQRCRLQLGPTALHDQAKEAFQQLGALLQKRRRAALAESMDALTGAEEWRGRDPSAADPTLGEKLAQSAAEGSKKLNEVFSEFVQRQETVDAERRMKRAETDKDGDGKKKEENEDEDEDQEDEDSEESEVTDEELEVNREEPAGADTFGLDDSDHEDVPMDVELFETGVETTKRDESNGTVDGPENKVMINSGKDEKTDAPDSRSAVKVENGTASETIVDLVTLSSECSEEVVSESKKAELPAKSPDSLAGPRRVNGDVVEVREGVSSSGTPVDGPGERA